MSDNTPIDAATEIAGASKSFFDFIQSVFQPNITKRTNKAQLKAAKEQIDFIQNHPEFDISFNDSMPQIKQRTDEQLLMNYQRRQLSDGIKKEQNLEDIINIAADDMKYETETPKKHIEMDWWNRFEQYAENVSNDDMKVIWGKILSGEFKNPGSFSLRTLNAINNISKEEAELFQFLLPYSFCLGENKSNNIILLSSMFYKNVSSLNNYVLSLAHETGLVNQETGMALNIYKNKTILYYGNDYKIVVRFKYDEDSSKLSNFNFPISIIDFTSAGKEICNIIDIDFDIKLVLPILKNIKLELDSVDNIRVYKYNSEELLYDVIYQID